MALAKLGEGDKAASLFSLLNPINHARAPADAHRYKVEPYVVAADVYALEPHVGRGGWTWYTGSAGWMQRAGVESILGLRIIGASLHFDPCIPKDWPAFGITLRYRTSRYDIDVEIRLASATASPLRSSTAPPYSCARRGYLWLTTVRYIGCGSFSDRAKY